MIVNFNEELIDCSDEFSLRDFTNQFVDIPDGSIVYGSCFSQEESNPFAFRDNMIGCTFLNCNLDGVFMPSMNSVRNI